MGDQGPSPGGGAEFRGPAPLRCPACGARNPASAAWCTQCFQSFASNEVGADEPDTPAPGATDAAGASTAIAHPPAAGEHPPGAGAATPTDGAASRAGAPDDDLVDASARDVRTRDGEVEWRCATCGGWNALTASVCTACGAARQGFGEPAAATEIRTDREPAVVIGASVLLPGAGHLLMGRVGTGIARLLLALLWALGGVAMLAGDAGGAAQLPAMVLFVGALAVWIGSVLDARSLVMGSSAEVLGSRVLLWLVVGVTVALVAALLLTATSDLV